MVRGARLKRLRSENEFNEVKKAAVLLREIIKRQLSFLLNVMKHLLKVSIPFFMRYPMLY